MKAPARIRRHAAVWGRMLPRPRRAVAVRSLAATMIVLALVGLLMLSALSPAQAQGPIGGAWQTIVAATVEAQETTNAQAAQAASQRATASALDLQMRQAAATATRAALLQQAADAQATRAAESARATQTAEAQATAQAVQATAQAWQVQATATEAARRDATATAQILAAQADATRAANATATIEQIHADATRTALALSTQNAQAAALFQTLFSGSAIVILWLLAAMLFLLLVKQLRSSKPRPVVVVSDPASFDSAQDVPFGGAEGTERSERAQDVPFAYRSGGDEPPRSFVTKVTSVIEDPRAAHAIAQILAEQMGDDIPSGVLHVEVDHDADPTDTNSTE